MIDELRSMAIFAETIKQGSFRAAAKKLQLSPSVVSYQVTQLENHLGTALIYRSTRNLSLTNEGKVLFQYALSMVESAHQGLNLVTSKQQELRGTLTVTLPSALIKSDISRNIAKFAKSHALLNLNFIYTDERQNLIEQGIDIAFRAGEMEDSNLIATRVGEIKRKLVCSYEFAQMIEEPISPVDIEQYNWIKLTMLPNRRTLIDANGEKVDISFKSNVSVNSVEAMTELCLNGLGIATPPDYLVEKGLKDRSLVELLTNWKIEPIPIYAVWPSNVFQSSNAKRLLSFLNQTTQ
ncbi:HTH-type transcriptional regulator DmlR [Pseudoalteromonas sp. P1-13-1a]|uniref:LysR family transcriptional regulator n=1 Tax=unclassified Pseudoalteromonas TaxID=194690 RepID=UPI0006E720BB|nr:MULTISPECIES: LysR family transcriptional regulator [unclassified Pseudoalteromonas]KPZ51595.1 HTH-type transcriptional regulator DmlR [Pseudoalteromonas sp. P1-13-1a]KPZ51903.1 HTH-type transcriptional regulator DmlR [Pseudoalteromonas sp. P1-7a]